MIFDVEPFLAEEDPMEFGNLGSLRGHSFASPSLDRSTRIDSRFAECSNGRESPVIVPPQDGMQARVCG